MTRDAFTCPCCGATSAHPADIAHGYCGRCHAFTGDPELGPAHLANFCPERKAKDLSDDKGDGSAAASHNAALADRHAT